MTAPDQQLDTEFPIRDAAPQALGQDVPASLGDLLNKHGTDAAMDSRRHLRRPRWSRIANATHAMGAGLLTAGALFTSLQHTASAALAAALAITGAAVVLMSHATRPGRHALRELITATVAAVAVSWVTSLNPLQFAFDPGLTLLAWHAVTGAAALTCALVVIAGMAQAPQGYPRAVRFCAAMIGVFTTAALSV
jgi:VanZ family protein